jgi:uncharacterized membrane protein YeaQ/YmgE (transglycosylase-associated protein family)
MKIYFPEYCSPAFLSTKRDARWIIAIVTICFLAGLCGSYLLENRFGVLAIIVLGIVGILISAAVIALFYWSKIGQARCAPIKKTVPRIISEWHYRPKQAIRRFAVLESTGTEASDVLSPAPSFAINYHV